MAKQKLQQIGSRLLLLYMVLPFKNLKPENVTEALVQDVHGVCVT
jgi:hypothetical protein